MAFYKRTDRFAAAGGQMHSVGFSVAAVETRLPFDGAEEEKVDAEGRMVVLISADSFSRLTFSTGE